MHQIINAPKEQLRVITVIIDLSHSDLTVLSVCPARLIVINRAESATRAQCDLNRKNSE